MYATRTDMVERFTESEILMLESLDNTGPVPSATEAALSDAKDVIASFIQGRYALPLPSVPVAIRIAACDIARFLMYKDRPTENVIYRYEKTLEWLKLLAAGKVGLVFDPPLTPEQEEANRPALPVGAQYTGGDFGDAVLNLMPGGQYVRRWR